jgi:hypothetical protein
LKKCILLSSIAEHTTVADHHDSVPNGEDNERYSGGPRTRLHESGEQKINKFYATAYKRELSLKANLGSVHYIIEVESLDILLWYFF